MRARYCYVCKFVCKPCIPATHKWVAHGIKWVAHSGVGAQQHEASSLPGQWIALQLILNAAAANTALLLQTLQ